ncbi:MAG: FAD-binding protein, partial [Pseudomonadota bacterium]
NIQVIYEAAADKLLANAQGEIVGVRALCKGKKIYVKASKAVVMTLGGFEFNEEMKLNFLKVYPTYFAGSPANTGDGIGMVQEVGAQLWHMNCCSAGWVLKFPDFPIGLGPNFGGSRGFQKFGRDAVTGYPCGFIIVDQYGKRFTNEIYKRHGLYYELSLYDSQKLVYPRVPSYWIFDSKRIKAGPLPMMSYGPMLYRLYKWSEDNGEEIKGGWVIQGEDLEDLAHQLEMDSSILNETLQNYNSCCARGKDIEFSRPPQHLVPLKEPPFFAVRIWPGSANTQGGPRRDSKARVLNTEGEPIPGLYAAGEFGSVYGMLYPATGGNIAECIAFGRIAGENAAKEPNC